MSQFRTRIIAVGCLVLLLSTAARISTAPAALPRPDHVVIVVEENHSFAEIYNSSSAPFINSLVSQGLLFTQSFAIEHPSEPNYLDLFSGSNQGINDDGCPYSFSAPNLASQLIAAGLSFGGYSEDLPAKGSAVCSSGSYARKHNPWVNFDNGTNAVPPGANKPFIPYFPTTPSGFAAMPTVSIVVPNLQNDMHDGSIEQGDAWFWNNLSAYYQWAQTHNSLLILTFDEDDSSSSNQVFTLFLGPMVTPGLYTGPINHFNILRTIEDMYGLPHAGAAQTATPISAGWTTSIPGAPMLQAQPGAGGVALSWSAVGGAQSYNVYRGSTSNGETPLATGLTGTSYVDTAVANGATYYYTVTAVNANGEGIRSNETAATLGASGGSAPFGGAPAAIPGTIEAENFDEGGQFVSYVDTTSGNRGGAYRQSDVDVGAVDASGGYYIGWTRAGEWVRYTVAVAAADTYTLQTRVANVGAGASFHVEVDGIDRTGPIGLPDTGGWSTWQTITTPGIALGAGQRIVRLVFDTVGSSGGVGNFNWLRFTGSGTTPSTTPFGGAPVALPGVVQAPNFDNGPAGSAYYDTSAGNTGAAYRSTDVDIGATANAGGIGYYVGWTRVGEWLTYTVNATTTRTYTVSALVANVGTGAAFRIEVDGVDRTGSIALPNTGGWDAWQTVSVGDIAVDQGQHVVRVVMVARNGDNSGVGNYAFLSLQ